MAMIVTAVILMKQGAALVAARSIIIADLITMIRSTRVVNQESPIWS